MKVEKKKMSYGDLEEHVIDWCVDRIQDMRDTIDEIEDDQDIPKELKNNVYYDLSKRIEHIVNLMEPLRHDNETLVEWCISFVNEYDDYHNS
jgi:hypothetical protein